MNGHLGIAGLVVKAVLLLVALAFVMDAIGQITGKFEYHPDAWVVEMFRLVITASIFVLGVGGVAGWRMLRNKDGDK